MIKVPLYANASETWKDDLAIPMDFSGKVNMYKGGVCGPFVGLILIAHSIISYAVYLIILLLHRLFHYVPVARAPVYMMAEHAEV